MRTPVLAAVAALLANALASLALDRHVAGRQATWLAAMIARAAASSAHRPISATPAWRSPPRGRGRQRRLPAAATRAPARRPREAADRRLRCCAACWPPRRWPRSIYVAAGRVDWTAPGHLRSKRSGSAATVAAGGGLRGCRARRRRPRSRGLRGFIAERFRQRRPRDTASRDRGGGAVPRSRRTGHAASLRWSLLRFLPQGVELLRRRAVDVALCAASAALHVSEAALEAVGGALQRVFGLSAGGAPARSRRTAGRRARPRRAARSPLCQRRVELVELLAQLVEHAAAPRSSRSPHAPPSRPAAARAAAPAWRAARRRGHESSAVSLRSADLMRDQLRRTSSAPLTVVSANTCGWRRTIFSLIARMTSAM